MVAHNYSIMQLLFRYEHTIYNNHYTSNNEGIMFNGNLVR